MTEETKDLIVNAQDEDRPSIPVYLDPALQAISASTPDISMEDIEALKDVRVEVAEYGSDDVKDILYVHDLPNDGEIGHLVFRWLYPRRRSQMGMGFWRWVKGDLARKVRQKKIVNSGLGGGSGTTLITNGDLILAFAPRELWEKHKSLIREKNLNEAESLRSQRQLSDHLDRRFQDVTGELEVSETFEGRKVGR